jgi:hypothetical protein
MGKREPVGCIADSVWYSVHPLQPKQAFNISVRRPKSELD